MPDGAPPRRGFPSRLDFGRRIFCGKGPPRLCADDWFYHECDVQSRLFPQSCTNRYGRSHKGRPYLFALEVSGFKTLLHDNRAMLLLTRKGKSKSPLVGFIALPGLPKTIRAPREYGSIP